MDDGRGPGVEEVKAFQDLPAPASKHLRLHNFKPLQVALEKTENRHPFPASCLTLLKVKNTVNQAVQCIPLPSIILTFLAFLMS